MAHLAVSQVELYISCKGVKRTDAFSKSDPFVVVYLGSAADDGPVIYSEMGRSETVDNTQDPEFVKPFQMGYAFYDAQYVQVKLFDEDKVTSDEYLGEVSFRLAELMAAPGQRLALDMKQNGKRGQGKMLIRGEEMASVSEWLRLSLRGAKLANKDGLFGKSDPFYIISRMTEAKDWLQVHKSETVMDNLSPVWQPAEISLQKLCNGDWERPIKIALWDWDRVGKHDYMGGFQTTARELAGRVGGEFQVKDETKKGKKGELAGSIAVDRCETYRVDTLLDYIRGGLQISLSVAIDFTGSNGDPSHPSSLHYIDPSGRPNQYEQAIMAVGSILQDYDSDQHYPVYGFGGRVGGTVSHCFPIMPVYSGADGGAVAGSEVVGVSGILDAYRACIRSVTLAGPTLFAQVLDAASAAAAQAARQPHQQYQVLLILTDGVINDATESIERLAAASALPLSVLIIGVGAADFSQMQMLDADAGPLKTAAGATASRDVVQFVPFSRCRDPAALSREVLREVPGQFLSYCKARGIRPNPPRVAAPWTPPLSPASGNPGSGGGGVLATGMAGLSVSGGGPEGDCPPPYTP